MWTSQALRQIYFSVLFAIIIALSCIDIDRRRDGGQWQLTTRFLRPCDWWWGGGYSREGHSGKCTNNKLMKKYFLFALLSHFNYIIYVVVYYPCVLNIKFDVMYLHCKSFGDSVFNEVIRISCKLHVCEYFRGAEQNVLQGILAYVKYSLRTGHACWPTAY